MKKRMSQISGLRGGRFKLLSFAVKVQLMVYCLITIGCLESDWVDGASKEKKKVPCYFVFGDSQADNGNNNKVSGLIARADYKPYGIDFSDQGTPTGRFTNGRNVPDFIAEYLGFSHSIPPFKNRKHRSILTGVNYASGGSGILQETGRKLGEITSIDEQLENHNKIISKLRGLLGKNSAVKKHLKSCLYTVQIGSNDYLNNYFMPRFYTTSSQFSSQDYAMALNKELSRQLKSLYGVGARKVAVFGVGAIGCTPYARANYGHGGSPCVDAMNSAIQIFNIGLKSLVLKLNTQLDGAKFTFIDIYKISSMKLPEDSEMVLDAPCCSVLPGEVQCARLGSVCENRKQYLFWDAVHPTDIGFMAVAKRAFKAQESDDADPYDINHLVNL